MFNLGIVDGTLVVKCYDKWTKDSVHRVLQNIDYFTREQKNILFDLSDVTSFDSAGALVVLHIQKVIQDNGFRFDINGLDSKKSSLIKLCNTYDVTLDVASAQNAQKTKYSIDKYKIFDIFGRYIINSTTVLIAFLSFVGGAFVHLIKSILNPKKIRFSATIYHIEQSGLYAVPIIVITSLLIGVVLAYQGAVQLAQFGANIFIVEMIGIAATRELAPMIAAIVIAGRSASSFSAQIGVMKLTDEVDAMKTMGFTPWEFLVLPRVIALMIAVPLLVIVADITSILGGMLIAYSELGISYIEFIDRFKETVALKHILIGLIKAPVFGFIIAMIGCFRGFEINSSTESVGKYTTISVVNAIFWVIAFNALFSIVLTEIGI
ncbi:ABC transporter permease [Arcobacter sp. FWKO B]|uniref:ABC transporter permease n=1 Tax=Arcobacter sp. FWKO B TaxID=2593672 RepID=UPI0018A4791E|nr:MlaE family lipid ABC transporter permease subunit [Arcobacter sp. FWKO B]